MKIKEVFYNIIASLLVLFSVLYLVKGIIFSGSIVYSITIISLYVFVISSVSFIRSFFLLPKAIYMEILVTFTILFLFWFGIDKWIGGIRVVNMSKHVVSIIKSTLPSAKIGEFGTIGIVSICLSVVYQTLNFFK